MENNMVDGSPPWTEKEIRYILTQKWGRRVFISSIVMMGLVIVSNGILAPLFHRFINLKPSRFRQRTFSLPWINLSMMVWCAFLSAAAIVQTQNDLVTFVKRLGRMSVALMPPMYLLTMRPSPLPRVFYLQMIPMHKWLSRFVVVLATLHGLLYALVYQRQQTLSKLSKPANVYGIVALAMFVGMALTGWQRFRRLWYESFYSFHVISAWSCLILIKYHSRPNCDWYMIMCGLLLAYQVFFRIKRSTRVKLRVQYISPTLLLAEIPKTVLPPRMWNWTPGGHVRLSDKLTNPLTWAKSSHPYSIASLPDDPTMKLVIRPGDYKIRMRKEYSLFGPHQALPMYLRNQISVHMLNRVLLVIGGSGIAFGAPIMRYLRLNGAQVRMVWAIRDPCDARALPMLGLHDDMMAGSIEVYYTGEPARVDGYEDEFLTVKMSDECCNDVIPAGAGATQSKETRRVIRGDPVLRNYMSNMYNHRPHLNLRLKSWMYGYDMSNDDCCCADRIIESCPEDRLGAWVFSSGGPELMETARLWAELSGVCYFQDSFTI